MGTVAFMGNSQLDAMMQISGQAYDMGNPDSTHECDGCATCQAKRMRTTEFSLSRRANKKQATTDMLMGLELLALSDSDWLGGPRPGTVRQQEHLQEHAHQEEVAVADWPSVPDDMEGRRDCFYSHDHCCHDECFHSHGYRCNNECAHSHDHHCDDECFHSHDHR